MGHVRSLHAAGAAAEALSDEAQLQRQLASHNRTRLIPSHASGDWQLELRTEFAWRRMEGELLERERARVQPWAARAPRQAEAFVAWFEALERDGPGQGDALFPWLRDHASLEQMRWFLRQEMAGEAGFDDLVALTQVRIPDRAKLELARNYWDEMGQGHAGGMHSPLLRRLGEALDVTGPRDQSDIA